MRYGSVCSGIEAASLAWGPLGWSPAWFAEIDPFACAVLKHRWPHVPNLGDMTTIHGKREFQDEPIDVLVGGTPCQSFSIAGLRGGMADPRGNLAIVFLGLVARKRPRYVVWENVPGVISDKTKAFFTFIDGLEALGYAIECDILDANHFGVPQRRRRVFCIAHNVALGRKQKTSFFVLMVAQLLTDFLLTVLAEHKKQSGCSELGSASQAKHSADGLRRRMKLFAMPLPTQRSVHTTIDALKSLLRDWVEALSAFQTEPSCLDYHFGGSSSGKPPIEGVRSLERGAASACLSISPSWSAFLDAVCAVARSSTTLTGSRQITASEIFSCAQVSLSICDFICKLLPSWGNSWNEESCGLTALREFTNYARSANSPLFVGLDGFYDWGGFERSATPIIRALERHLGTARERACALFPLSASLRGDSPPRREAGKRVARPIAAGSPGGSGYRNDADTADNLIEVSPALRAVPNSSHRADSEAYAAMTLNAHGGSGRLDGESETFVAVAHTLRADGFNAGEDGTGRGTPIIAFNARQDPDSGEVTHALDTDGSSIGILAPSMGVRRLMPVECVRLMGMPDGHTAITYRGKPAADGPRYRAIGNSMAVPAVRWIGQRLQLVEDLHNGI